MCKVGIFWDLILGTFIKVSRFKVSHFQSKKRVSHFKIKSLMCSNDKTICFYFVFSPNIFITNLFIIFFKSHFPDLRIIYYL